MLRSSLYQALRAVDRPTLRLQRSFQACPLWTQAQGRASRRAVTASPTTSSCLASAPVCSAAFSRTPRRSMHSSARACTEPRTLPEDSPSSDPKEYGDGRVIIQVEPHIGDGPDTRTVLNILKSKIPRGYTQFAVALDHTGLVLSLSDPIPRIHNPTLHFIPFPDQITPTASLGGVRDLQRLSAERGAHLARRCFWASSGYVLGAAIQLHQQSAAKDSKLYLSGAPELVEDVSGGAGFAYEFVLDHSGKSAEATPDLSIDPSFAAAALVEAQSSTPPRLDEGALKSIQKMFETLVAEDIPIELIPTTEAEARQVFQSNPFKLYELWTLEPQDTVRFVKIGNFYLDLLITRRELPGKRRAALVPSTGFLRAVKIEQWSTASWAPPALGPDAPTTQGLLRVRGVSFPSPKQLKSHLAAQAAAVASDHRTIGRAQGLFMTSDAASPGSPFILPHGMRIARKVERVIRDLYDVHSYDEVHTPQLFKKELWERSGHWDNYQDDMFKVKGFREESAWLAARAAHDGHSCAAHGGKAASDEGDVYGLKPMNCPGHCLIYAREERSYRDLPLRFAEFGPLHRNESSGSLSGLTRVRRFHQDDAHVFCTPEQVAGEIQSMLRMLTEAYRAFGFNQIELVLSTRPVQFIGELEEWDKAEDALRAALNASLHSWTTNEGDGAFYGPKIDCRLVDAAGRKHQTATIQLDFQLPRRFNLRYADPKAADGSGYSQPVMIHRAILGSVERFMAILIESSGGRWPFWLSPRQAIVLPVADTPEILAQAEYVRDYLALGSAIAYRKRAQRSMPPDARTALPALERPSHHFHVDTDRSGERLSKMMQRAAAARYNFVLFIGEEETRTGMVSVRVRDDYAASAAAQAQQNDPDGAVRTSPAAQLQKSMGTWSLTDLRELFEHLDSHHI